MDDLAIDGPVIGSLTVALDKDRLSGQNDRCTVKVMFGDQGGAAMPEYMDVHTGMHGVTTEALLEAHNADLAIQDDEGVNFKHAWADPATGMVFCLSDAPSSEAVQKIHERAGHPADHVYEVAVQA